MQPQMRKSVVNPFSRRQIRRQEGRQELLNHMGRVMRLSHIIAMSMGWTSEDVLLLKLAAKWHDIGKDWRPWLFYSHVPFTTPEQWAAARDHPLHGAMMLLHCPEAYGVTQKQAVPVAIEIANHHQYHQDVDESCRIMASLMNLDDQIDVTLLAHGARIIKAVDYVVARTERRHYAESLTLDDALTAMGHTVGTEFSPEVYAVLKQMRDVASEYIARAS